MLVEVKTRFDEEGPDHLEQLEADLASGAHFISTDVPEPVDWTSYVVDMPGGTPSRCNPRSAPSECTSEALEDPAFLD